MRGKYVAALAATLALTAPAAAIAGPPAPVDPQNWTFQDNFHLETTTTRSPGKDYSSHRSHRSDDQEVEGPRSS